MADAHAAPADALHAASEPPRVDDEAVQACADALLAPYDEAVKRAQAALAEIRRARGGCGAPRHASSARCRRTCAEASATRFTAAQRSASHQLVGTGHEPQSAGVLRRGRGAAARGARAAAPAASHPPPALQHARQASSTRGLPDRVLASPPPPQVGFIPVYQTRAQAAAREMRALRARVDRSLARAAALAHSAETGAPLVPTDLGAYAEAASGLTSSVTSGLTGSLAGLTSVLGWGSSSSAPQQQAQPPPATQMEAVDGGSV